MWHEERLLIDGELGPAEAGRAYETVNPATGEVLGTAADATVGDAERAVAVARRTFDTTSWATDRDFRPCRVLRQNFPPPVRVCQGDDHFVVLP